jgi:hypothetical protein
VLVLVEYRPDARLLGLLPIVRSDRAVCVAFGTGAPPNPPHKTFQVRPKDERTTP